MKPLIVIPARLAATRLPGKPLARIGNAPMIVHVMRRAFEAELGDVIVACDAEEIASAVREAGGQAILTNPAHPSGSDRIWEAVQKFDPYPEGELASPSRDHALTPAASGSRSFGATQSQAAGPKYDIIVNLQGDVPTLEPRLLHALLAPLHDQAVDISTLATVITRPEEHANPAVVKAILSQPDGAPYANALYFTRATAPSGDGPRYHHIGVYGYRRAALQKFVSLAPSPLEKREKLEQLRALEHGLRIGVAVVDTVPLGVDTPEDLARARELLE